MSKVSPKPDKEPEETPSCWSRNCGPQTTAFKIRVQIQQVRTIKLHKNSISEIRRTLYMDAHDAGIVQAA